MKKMAYGDKAKKPEFNNDSLHIAEHMSKKLLNRTRSNASAKPRFVFKRQVRDTDSDTISDVKVNELKFKQKNTWPDISVNGKIFIIATVCVNRLRGINGKRIFRF